jgi:hypothetical protein
VIEHLVDEEALVGREFGDFAEELGDGRGLEVEVGEVGGGGEGGRGGGFNIGRHRSEELQGYIVTWVTGIAGFKLIA